MKLIAAPSSRYGYSYRCSADGNYSNTIQLSFVSNWLGTIYSAWENPSNWICNLLPDANTDIVIGCAKNVTEIQIAFVAALR